MTSDERITEYFFRRAMALMVGLPPPDVPPGLVGTMVPRAAVAAGMDRAMRVIAEHFDDLPSKLFNSVDEQEAFRRAIDEALKPGVDALKMIGSPDD
jgi:hypothetical protein